MVDSIMNIITIDLLVKQNHFYHQRTVQIRNGILKYYKPDTPNTYLFEANLSDIILIEKDSIDAKAEILLSSKSNSFALIKLSHDNNHILHSFKTQLERLIDIENNKIIQSEEQIKVNAKTKRFNELIEKYSLISLGSIPSDISDIINANYSMYKHSDEFEVFTTNKAKTAQLDQSLFLYEKILSIKEGHDRLVRYKGKYQFVLFNCITVAIVVLLILYYITDTSAYIEKCLYHIIMLGLILYPFTSKISLFVNSRVKYCDSSKAIAQLSTEEFIIKSTTSIQMNTYAILECIIKECLEQIIRAPINTKVLSHESFMVHFDTQSNCIILIEGSKDLSKVLSVYVLHSNALFNKTQLSLYSVLIDGYPIDYKKNAHKKLSTIIWKIQLKLEEGFFNTNEGFLINDDIDEDCNDNLNDNDNDNNDSIDLNNDNKLSSNVIDTNLISNSNGNLNDIDYIHNATLLLKVNYEDIITSNANTNILKQEISINKDKDQVINFALNCNNLVLVNDYLKTVELSPKERMIQFNFEFETIGDITVKASSEYEDIEINGIEYTVICYKNNNKEMMHKVIDHFGFYIWSIESCTNLCSWIKCNLDLFSNTYDKEALLIELKTYLDEYNKFKTIIDSIES